MKDMVPYGMLKKNLDTERIKQELEYRNLPTDGGWLKDLLKRLKEDENDEKAFYPKNPVVDWSDVWLR
jgi:hypothetical protein